MKNKIKIILTLIVCLILITSVYASGKYISQSTSQPDGSKKKDTVIKGGVGDTWFVSGKHAYIGYPGDQIISATNGFHPRIFVERIPYSEWIEKYMNNANLNSTQKKEVRKLVSEADYIGHRTNETRSIEENSPVLYRKDPDPKKASDFIPDNFIPKGKNDLATAFDILNKATSGDLARGVDYPTTFIYTMREKSDEDPCKEFAQACCADPRYSHRIECMPGIITNCPDPGCGEPKIEQTSCDVSNGPQYEFQKTEEEGTVRIEGVFSVMVEIVPVKPSDYNSMSATQKSKWDETHKPQVVGPVLTEYGKFLLQNKSKIEGLSSLGKGPLNSGANSYYRKSWDKIEEGANKAIAKGVPELEIILSEKNKEGFSRGGVFTFIEKRKSAVIETTHLQDYYTQYYCEEKTKKVCTTTINEDGEEEKSCVDEDYTERAKHSDGHILNGQYAKGPVSIKMYNPVKKQEIDEFYIHSSYQELNVRCNKTEFQNLVSKTGSTVKTFGSGNGSSTAQSPVVKNAEAKFFNNLSTSFFYSDTSCRPVFGCAMDKNVYYSGNDNDSTKNVGNSGNSVGKWGAQSDGKTGDKFELFRDNIARLIRVDIPYLKPLNKTQEWVYDFGPSDATFITLDRSGTPDGDLFSFEDEHESQLISGNDLSSSNALVLDGQHNKFNWRASWASKKRNPHRLNLRYAYILEILNNSPNSMKRDGKVKFEQEGSIINMYCDFEPNKSGTSVPDISNKPRKDNYTEIKTTTPNKALTVEFKKTSNE